MPAKTSILALVCGLAGCAAGPGTPATATTQPAATKQIAPATSTATPGGADAQAVEVKQRVPPGYRAATKEGVVVYCKSTATLGSRFEKEVCVTPEAYKELEAEAERTRQDMRRSIGICGGTTGCNGG